MDCKGRQHETNIVVCKCEPEAATLVRMRLWPSSPKKPTVVFLMDVLEWQRILFLEGQLSVQAFSAALQCLSDRMANEDCSKVKNVISWNFYELVDI